MLPRFKCLCAGFVLCAVLNSCGSAPKSFDVSVKQTRPSVSVGKQKMSQAVNTSAAGNAAVLQRERAVFLWVGAYHAPEPVPQREQPVSVTIPTSPSVVTDAPAPSSMPCGGIEYPPCYVAQRESGNTYDAYNPTGCGGSGCYGRWQFSGAWAGKLGLPDDISQATPAQQDEAARQLWASGSGCSNWDAC